MLPPAEFGIAIRECRANRIATAQTINQAIADLDILAEKWIVDGSGFAHDFTKSRVKAFRVRPAGSHTLEV
jgi:hypothetical protein